LIFLENEESMANLFWLVTTDHLTDRLWFRDEEDFKVAMNIIAALSTMMGLKIISFILMSNHVHFVLGCEKSVAIRFITRFKKLYSQYYSHKYGSCELLRDNKHDIQPVIIRDESFEKAVAYVHMNSVAANICLHPTGYPWGTGACFFNTTARSGKKLGEYSGRARIRLLHSKLPVPDTYILNEQGFISPESYVPVKFVESVFRTPKRMAWFLNNSSKAKRLKEAPSFHDQLIAAAIQDLSISLFKKSGFQSLEEPQQAELLRQIRFRFSSDPAQIARVCGASYETVCSLLESFPES